MSKKKKKKGKKFTGEVTKTRAIKIFEALSFKTAGTWNVIRLQKKIQDLPNLIEGTKFTSKMQRRVDIIVRALGRGVKITVVDVEDATADAKRKQEIEDAAKREAKRKSEKKTKDKSKAKAKAKKTAKKNATKKQAKKAVVAKEKKPGLMLSMYEFIQAHQPISARKILSMLKQRFPNKNPESMERCIPRYPKCLADSHGITDIGQDDKECYIITKK